MRFASFLHGEDGAVTVDWVVLTAAVIGFALSVTIFFSSARGVGVAVNDSLLTAEVVPVGDL